MEAVRVGTFGTLPPDEALEPGNKVVSITCRIAPGLAAEVAVFVCALHLPSGPLEVRESVQALHLMSMGFKREV